MANIKFKFLLLAIVFITGISFSQFREIPTETKTKLKDSGLFLGFINMKNFSLSHSVSLSYHTSGNSSVSLSSYTATLGYKISSNMNISADITMQYSPFASIGSGNPSVNRDFQNSFNGINISRLSFNYRPFKNMFINIDYHNYRNNVFSNGYYGRSFYGNPFWENEY